jgi:prophage regulatory protein
VADRILRRPTVTARTGLSRATIYRYIASGAFPRPVQLTAHAVGWKESEIQAWLDSRTRTGASDGVSEASDAA